MAVKPNDRIIPISVETLNANLLNSAKQAV
jgi:hypothetical protein